MQESKEIIDIQAEPFKVIIKYSDGSNYTIETINATSILASVKMSELYETIKEIHEAIEKESKIILSLNQEISLLSEKIELQNVDENNKQSKANLIKEAKEKMKICNVHLKSYDDNLGKMMKMIRDVLAFNVKDFEKHKELLYTIPDEHQQKLFYMIRLASLGNSSKNLLNDMEKKMQSILKSITNLD